MKTIFCPVDFTSESHLAAEWATMLAVKRNWKLILFNKFLIFSDGVQEDSNNPLEDARKLSEENLLQLKANLCKKFNTTNFTCNIDTDFGIDTEDVILKSAVKANADLIVMGTKGAESFGDIIGGSNTTNLINQTDIPVLVIPETAASQLPLSFVYATDLEDEDSSNLSFVLEFAKDLNAQIKFLHLNKKGEKTELGKLKEIISTQISHAPANLVKGIEMSFKEVVSNDFFIGLEEYANNNGIGMIVLGRHPRNFFEKLMHGDSTRLMALYSFLPVLIIHKKD